MIKHGEKVLLLGVGPILSEAISARKKLEEEGINLAIASMGSVKPLDEAFLKNCIDQGYKKWITLEEHFKNGGLGSAILEWLNENNENSITVHRIGVEDHFIHKLGNQKYTRTNEGLSCQEIARKVREA